LCCGREMYRVGIEAPGVGGVGEVVEAVEEPGRLAGDHDDRPGGPEPHDLVRGQQGPPLDVFASWPEVTKRSDLTHKRTNHELRPPYERHLARP
jgi:hypothetical protein